MINQIVQQVAVGIIENNNHILMATRRLNQPLHDYYEFPGGKVDANETPKQALQRELFEELDIEHIDAQLLLILPWQYPHINVQLHVFLVSCEHTSISAKEQQNLVWAPLDRLHQYRLLPTCLPILSAMRLTRQYYITPPISSTQLLQGIQALCAKADDQCLIYLRQTQLNQTSYFDLVAAIDALKIPHLTIMQDRLPLFKRNGLHLNKDLLNTLSVQTLSTINLGHHAKQPYLHHLLGASCHDSKQIQTAQHLGADFITLSPVCKTNSHPNTTAMGWERFQDYAKLTPLPVFALGGLQLDDLIIAQSHYAFGIAGIEHFWPSSI